MIHIARIPLLFPVCLAALFAADKYDGPKPPTPDIPFLLHANHLVEPDVAQATEEKKKDEMIYRVVGPAASARTPLAEPIFIFESAKIAPEAIELYKFDVRNGNREVVMNKKRGPHAVRLLVTPLGGKLYRIEVNEGLGLESGQYGLTPKDSNQVFCFEVY